jgi:hypothetical protein
MRSANNDKIKKAVGELMMRLEYEYKPKKGARKGGRFIEAIEVYGEGEDDDGDIFIKSASCIPTPVVQFLLGEIEKPEGLTIKLGAPSIHMDADEFERIIFGGKIGGGK